ncbi:transporter substrate-binding domain-containing protein [Zophobihabitans entericus]|uniref:Transporter substrate-binding domain-containing protein n=1 Tax=Zophobihabitans entericus TaxID=1635327 RepID=A0A6G9ICV4_9GAMM|nr:transporter substrate-binding domain-containing protein [Zophobihabitans entericus]QIQ22066.1 transporter substrate-binding domain-containing protein [Zophobihabitans entericus]
MKKLICSILLILLAQTSQARTNDEIMKSGMLFIGVPGDYAPLAFFNENGRLTGFDVDMAKNLAKTMKLTPVFVLSSWPTLSADLAADNFDIAMGGVTYTNGRAQQFLLSESVVPNGKIALASCQSAPKLTDIDAINQEDVRVVVNPGGTNESFVNGNIHTAQIIRVKDNFDNIQALRDKTADMMVTDLIEGMYYEHNEPGVLCMATTKPFAGTESYKVYMLKKENPELLQTINNWLNEVNKDELLEKWGIKAH